MKRIPKWLHPFGPLILGYLRWRYLRRYSRKMTAQAESYANHPMNRTATDPRPYDQDKDQP